MMLCATVLLCSACAFAPQVATDQPYANRCNMKTQKLTLTPTKISNHINCNGHSHDAIACLLIQGVIAPVGSFIISGSIVAVNNTIHWLEYQGTCAVDAIVKQTKDFKEEVKGTSVDGSE
jgi:hypothetical protein